MVRVVSLATRCSGAVVRAKLDRPEGRQWWRKLPYSPNRVPCSLGKSSLASSQGGGIYRLYPLLGVHTTNWLPFLPLAPSRPYHAARRFTLCTPLAGLHYARRSPVYFMPTLHAQNFPQGVEKWVRSRVLCLANPLLIGCLSCRTVYILPRGGAGEGEGHFFLVWRTVD